MDELLKLIEKNREDEDFKRLEKQLHEELLSRYGAIQESYSQHDKLHANARVVVAYRNNVAVACGCLQIRDAYRAEIKRMYVDPKHRNKNIAGQIIKRLEEIARDLCLRYLLLETGIRQPESIALYDKFNYSHIDSFRHEEDIQESIFFGKHL